jgi:hypothetical protein
VIQKLSLAPTWPERAPPKSEGLADVIEPTLGLSIASTGSAEGLRKYRPLPTWKNGNPKAGFPLSHARFLLSQKIKKRKEPPLPVTLVLQAHLWIRKDSCKMAPK